jgi:beta propeller repeat protein
MRIALMSDVHSNLPAAQAVAADIRSRGVDQAYHLGDLVGYSPWPNETVEFMRSSGIKCLQGNYDESVGGSYYNVHLYDIRSGNDRIIAFGNVRSCGAIGGDPGNGNGKIALLNGDDYSTSIYDIDTGETAQVYGSSTRPRMCPAIAGNSLVFAGNDGIANGMYVISLYDHDLDTGETITRMSGMPDPHDIQTRGRNTVWWLRNGENRLVALLRHDRYDSAFAIVSPEGVTSDMPRVSGRAVAYRTIIDGTSHINVFDINTRTTLTLPGTGHPSSCDVYAGRVVYDDDRYGNRDIYAYDLSTGIETRLTDNPRDQTSPAIWNGYVAFMDDRNGGWDLYVLTTGPADT